MADRLDAVIARLGFRKRYFLFAVIICFCSVGGIAYFTTRTSTELVASSEVPSVTDSTSADRLPEGSEGTEDSELGAGGLDLPPDFVDEGDDEEDIESNSQVENQSGAETEADSRNNQSRASNETPESESQIPDRGATNPIDSVSSNDPLLSDLPVSSRTGPGQSFYVDCEAGSDQNSGASVDQAWQTIAKANDAALAPGQNLLFKSGCSWSGERLDAEWDGTLSRPVYISSYGTGSKPTIKNNLNAGVKVTGSFQVISDLNITFEDLDSFNLAGCAQPFGDHYGINLTQGAAHNVVMENTITKAAAGIHIASDSSSNLITNNVITDNGAMTRLGGDPALDLGAWGILLRSDNNEVSYNFLSNNVANCVSTSGVTHSNSIEIFEAKGNLIHHNVAINDRVFSELGSSASEIAANNTYEYNLHSSDIPDSRFITTRGEGSAFGPVNQTIARHNTVNLTGQGSIGISCGPGCDQGTLTVMGNILVAVEKTIFTSDEVNESRNLFWNPLGETIIQYRSVSEKYSAGEQVLSNSVVADPEFVNVAQNNFRVGNTSPAIGLAAGVAKQSSSDLEGRSSGNIAGAFGR